MRAHLPEQQGCHIAKPFEHGSCVPTCQGSIAPCTVLQVSAEGSSQGWQGLWQGLPKLLLQELEVDALRTVLQGDLQMNSDQIDVGPGQLHSTKAEPHLAPGRGSARDCFPECPLLLATISLNMDNIGIRMCLPYACLQIAYAFVVALPPTKLTQLWQHLTPRLCLPGYDR